MADKSKGLTYNTHNHITALKLLVFIYEQLSFANKEEVLRVLDEAKLITKAVTQRGGELAPLP